METRGGPFMSEPSRVALSTPLRTVTGSPSPQLHYPMGSHCVPPLPGPALPRAFVSRFLSIGGWVPAATTGTKISRQPTRTLTPIPLLKMTSNALLVTLHSPGLPHAKTVCRPGWWRGRPSDHHTVKQCGGLPGNLRIRVPS